jgi:DNA mismatch repair protein MutL
MSGGNATEKMMKIPTILALACGLACLPAISRADTFLFTVIPSAPLVGTSAVPFLDVSIQVSGLATQSLAEYDVTLAFDPALLAHVSTNYGDPVLGDQLELNQPSIKLQPPNVGVGTVEVAQASTDTESDLNTLQLNTFIIAVDDEGIAIIDQHVAHERILFEQIAERLTSRTLESQGLLTPVVLDLGPGAHHTLLQHRAALVQFGFDFEDFGGTSTRLLAVPAILDWRRAEEALRAVAADLDGLVAGAGVNEVLRPIAATMACHAAVKANDPLTREKMQYLLDELRRTAYSTICPHGRPVLLRLTRREIERAFDRA